MPTGIPDSDKTVQDRLLDTAEQLFCDKGFEGTSVRDLAAAAECNVASVNYYFGGKDKLYTEMWRRHLLRMRDARLASIDRAMSQSAAPTLENLLRSFAIGFLEPLADERRGLQFVRLMAREMLDRRLPGGMFVKEMILPVMQSLEQALTRICPQLDQTKAKLAILSIVGQLMHAAGTMTMFAQSGEQQVPKYDVAEIIEHIVAFSAAGIRAYAQQPAQDGCEQP
jgi:AcrR family transcriptional regulator